MATVEEFVSIFNAVPYGEESKNMETLGAKNKGKTKDGTKDKWGIMVNGSWYNTINPQHGEVIDTLEKGDQFEAVLVERNGFKNVDSITAVVDVNEDSPEPGKKTYKKSEDNRDWSFCASYAKDVAIAMATVSQSLDPLLPANMKELYDFFKGLKG